MPQRLNFSPFIEIEKENQHRELLCVCVDFSSFIKKEKENQYIELKYVCVIAKRDYDTPIPINTICKPTMTDKHLPLNIISRTTPIMTPLLFKRMIGGLFFSLTPFVGSIFMRKIISTNELSTY